VLDLDSAEGQAAVRRLAGRADVLIENFKVGGLAKYGLDHASLAALNPRLIYCSVTGFGQDGPYAHRAGYDFLVQGMSGAMSLTGEPDGEPMKTAIAYADVFTGLYAANAILAALHGRERTGQGCHIDAALLDTQVAVLGNQAMHYLLSGEAPPRLGNAHTAIVPYQVFPAADGHVIIACGNDGQFRRLCGALGEAWCDDLRFATNPARVAHRDILVPMVGETTARRTKAELLALLEAATVPAGPINTLDEVFADPQVVARGLVCRLPTGEGASSTTPSLRTPLVIDGVAQVAPQAAPALGQHGDTVLADDFWDDQP
jgi:crotonobetainyl-CoA:carnitine CoA-transferase CaiB-like acyl-CoA transferase